MINLKSISIILFLPLSAMSQNSVEHSKIQTEKNQEVTFDLYCLQNAISYINVIDDKKSSVIFEGELTSLESNSNATYKDYGVELKEEATQYFKLLGSDKVLAVKSLRSLRLSYTSLK